MIIPCFNEGKTVLTVLARVCNVSMPNGAAVEVIVVDDGSTDGRVQALREFEKTHEQVRLHVTPANLGKGAAVRIGLAMAGGDIIVIQDADLELNPEEIPRHLQNSN